MEVDISGAIVAFFGYSCIFVIHVVAGIYAFKIFHSKISGDGQGFFAVIWTIVAILILAPMFGNTPGCEPVQGVNIGKVPIQGITIRPRPKEYRSQRGVQTEYNSAERCEQWRRPMFKPIGTATCHCEVKQ